MKPFFLLLPALLAGSVLPAKAEVLPVYVGTYTDHSASHGIYRGTFDTASGRLGPFTLAVTARDPGFLAFGPGDRFLYAGLESAGHAAVASFAVKPDGSLAPLDVEPSGGEGTCFVSVDGAGRTLLAANYSAGSISAFRINPDGSLGARTALIPFHGSGPNLERQKGPHAHSIYVSPDQAFVYACDLGSDRVWIFRFDAARGTLSPNDPPSAPVPPGSGARHLVFSRDGRHVDVVNEMGNSVTVFARNPATGALTPLETVPTLLPGTLRAKVTSAEIALSSSDTRLYVSNRGCDTISVFAVDAAGEISLLQSVPAAVQVPRFFALDPTGRWLLVAGQKNSRIAVWQIDPATGKLIAPRQFAVLGAPVCLLFGK
jgi:6-phosphogluconolactonase